MNKLPDEYECIGTIMRNFDYEIASEAEKKLKLGPFYGNYTAWNFFGKVWWDNENFMCEIWQYHSCIAIIRANTLKEIMATACKELGEE